MVDIKGFRRCTLTIFLTSALLGTVSTKDILTSKCDGVAELRNGDFGLMNVTNNTNSTCVFKMSRLASLKRDLFLFDTARMNCTGNGAVEFPTGRGQKKNYCKQDKCLVFKRGNNKYPNEDILATVRGVFPTCTEYDIKQKTGDKIVATPETKSFTLRYVVLEMAISTSTAHASRDTRASSVTDLLYVSDQLRLHTTATAFESAPLTDTTVSARNSFGTPTSIETKPTLPKEIEIETNKIVLSEATTNSEATHNYESTTEGMISDRNINAGIDHTSVTSNSDVANSEATHNYESTTEGMISDQNINAGIDNTSGASNSDVASLGATRNKSNGVQAWHIAVPIAILRLITAVIVIFLIYKRKDKKKDQEHTATISAPAQA